MQVQFFQESLDEPLQIAHMLNGENFTQELLMGNQEPVRNLLSSESFCMLRGIDKK